MTKAPNAPSPAPVEAVEHGGIAGAHPIVPSRRCACSMSLSPRPGQVDDQNRLLARLLGQLQRMGEGVGGFEGADDPFRAGEQGEGVERLLIGRADIVGAAAVLEEGVLGPDRRIIEPGRDRPAFADLAMLVLQHIGLRAVQDAGPAAQQGRAMLAPVEPLPGGFDADQADARDPR